VRGGEIGGGGGGDDGPCLAIVCVRLPKTTTTVIGVDVDVDVDVLIWYSRCDDLV